MIDKRDAVAAAGLLSLAVGLSLISAALSLIVVGAVLLCVGLFYGLPTRGP